MKKIKNKILKKGSGLVLDGLLPLQSSLKAEVIAGIILAAISIPAVMGYAKIAGMPIVTGLYTILFPVAIFAIFSSSRHLVVGADSATAAILASTLLPFAVIESPEYIGLVSAVTILCAFFLILARIFKLSFIADFMSRTVLVGFLTGVGIQIAISQLPNIFGLNSRVSESTIPKLIFFFTHLSEFSLFTILLSVIVIVTILVLRRVSPRIPGELIVIIGTILANFLFNLQSLGISTVGTLKEGFPSLVLPLLNIGELSGVLIAASACFVVIIAQSTATSRAYSLQYSEDVDGDKDILGLALANGASGLTGGFVINGSPPRTEILSNAGGRSQLASLVTAFIVLVVIIFFTEPISFLPNAALASIVFLIGLNMVDIKGLKDIRRKMRSEYYLALITAIAVILFSVLWGIILSILFSMILHLSHSYKPVNSMLVKNRKGKLTFGSIKYGQSTKEGIIVYRFNRDLYYANSDKLHGEALKLVKKADPPIKWFVLDTGGFESIDYTAAEMIKSLYDDLKEKNVKLVLTMLLPSLKERLDELGLIKIIGPENIYKTNYKALESFENEN